MSDTPETEVAAGELTPAPAPKPQAMATLDDYQPVSPFANMSSFVKAQRVAHALASSTLVPDAYQQFVLNKNNQWQENPAAIGNCLIALEMASRMPGLSPLMVMQNMDVVKGRPGWRGAFAAGRVNASPLFGRLKYEWKGEPGTKEYGCRAYTMEAETGEVLYGTWITWAMVTGEGWDKNTKWTTMRDQMFMYRAATFWCRVHAPDLLLGLQTMEELEDVPAPGESPLRALNERLARQLDAPDGAEPAGDSGNAGDTAEAAPEKPKRQRRSHAAKVEPLPQNEPEVAKPAAQGVTDASVGDTSGMGQPSVQQTDPAAAPAAAAPAADFNVE